MIKTGGENVASREVEETIYRLPAVSEVAVIGVPHPRWVEAVAAVVVVKAGADARRGRGASSTAPAAWRASRCPSASSSSTALPKNPSGKLLKRELRQRYRRRRDARQGDPEELRNMMAYCWQPRNEGPLLGGEFWRGARLDAAWQIVFRRACEYTRARGRSRGDLRCHPH